jgi:hypothetical protein
MRYRIHTRPQWKNRAPATIRTRDGKVVHATPAFVWAIGKSVNYTLCWCWGRDMRVRCTGPQTRPDNIGYNVYVLPD